MAGGTTHIERLIAVLILALAAGACSRSSSSPAPRSTVTISGTVTFDLVPAVAGLGLDYPNTQPSPVRGATVDLVDGADVVATAVTDAAGRYSLSAARNIDAFVRVKAELVRAGSPGWDFRVLDNTNGDALYALDGAPFDTGAIDSTRDLHAASGWDESQQSYASPRSAAPFAILDVVLEAVELVLGADPAADFAPLAIHWSTANVPSLGVNGQPDLPAGEIGSSFFSPRFGIYLLGAEDVDTDEYDRHVIAHEWAHYFEDALSRSDGFGGAHARHDQLDMRVAFSEGWGNALSAIVEGQSVYRDVKGRQQQGAPFAFDIEGALPFNPNRNPGWYSEESLHEIIYDLFDADQDTPEDALELGFAPLYDVLVGQYRDSVALTSIFPFVAALKSDLPAEAASIDALLVAQSMTAIADEYGTGEMNSGNPANADVLPVYADITVNGPPVNVCSTDDFRSVSTGSVNKLGSRAFLKFTAGAAGSHTFVATATVVPAGESADPDMALYQRGSIAVSQDDPDPACTAAAPSNCEERFAMTLAAGDYVLEVYEWTNTNPADHATSPPIGRTCFDVEITQ